MKPQQSTYLESIRVVREFVCAFFMVMRIQNCCQGVCICFFYFNTCSNNLYMYKHGETELQTLMNK